MPSTLEVDALKNSGGTKTLAEMSGGSWTWGSGVPSGTIVNMKAEHTVVTAAQSLTTSGAVAEGSSVAYTPSTGASRVVYRYITQARAIDAPAAFTLQVRKAGTLVTGSLASWAESETIYDFGQVEIMWVFEDLSGWTTDQTIDTLATERSASYEVTLNQTSWSPAGATPTLVYPRYMIYSVM